MNRRNFLKGIFGGAVAASAVSVPLPTLHLEEQGSPLALDDSYGYQSWDTPTFGSSIYGGMDLGDIVYAPPYSYK